MIYDNICALSTAAGAGGVAVIRLSGPTVRSVAEKMFKHTGKLPVKEFEPYKMYTGEIDAGSFKDFGMCVCFDAPKSYTGENIVEFHCHGGIAIVNGILKRTIELGCRPADRGEYTKRAFLNGKLSLSSAEGLIDMINSESEGEIKAGYYLYRETLKKQVDAEQDKLTYILARIDASIDYPDEVEETAVTEETAENLISVRNFTEKLINSFSTGRKVKNGVVVGIVGKPNVGKSSLLNNLQGYEKAIVSSKAGTTRDIVEGEIDINGVRFIFKDTAGIRDTDDEIESIGVNRSQRVLNEADILLCLFDSQSFDEEDEKILDITKDKNRITVLNKTDLSNNNRINADICISAKTGEGVNELKKLLFNKTVGSGIDLYKDCLTEQRHYDALLRAKTALDNAINSLNAVPLDMVAVDIKNCWDILGEISGKTASEDIIDEIFSKFCVGK